MLETFRKHHYIMMCLIAAVVIVSFTFFFNPSSKHGGGAGGGVFGKFNGVDLTSGELEQITQLGGVVFQAAAGEKDGGRDFSMAMNALVNETQSRNSDYLDPDYGINVFIMRQECERLGIAVQKEDVEKRIRTLSAFQTNGSFDGSKLNDFLSNGRFGDRSATETKLVTAIKDVMMFERLSQLVGGSYGPSTEEVNAEFAMQNEIITASTATISKAPFEDQKVSDEEAQKYYDEEKAKKENPAKAAETDPVILTEEQRSVQYCITEAPKSALTPPVPPQPPAALPAKPDIEKLPEDQKKAKQDEWAALEADYKTKQEAFTKAMDEYNKAQSAYTSSMAEVETKKRTWLVAVDGMANAMVADADERAGRSFEALAKQYLEPVSVKPPPPAPVVVPPAPQAPAPAPAPALNVTPEKAPEAAPAPAPTPALGNSTPAPAPTPEGSAKPNAVQGAQGPSGQEGQPSNPPATPAAATPAEATPPAAAPAPAPATGAPAPAAPAANTPAPAPPPPPAFVRTATFTRATVPAEIQAINSAEGPASVAIFNAPKVNLEALVESSDKNSYFFFVVTGIVPPAVRPFAEVKDAIVKKLKEKKASEALKAAGESARSNILESLKGGKTFKEAAEAAKAVAAELPSFSRDNPLPPGTPNSSLVRVTVNGRGKAPLQAGEVSDPQPCAEGLLLVYVVKRELPKYSDVEDRKKKIRDAEVVSGVGNFASPYGMPKINPVFQSWFAARRSAAQSSPAPAP